VNPNIKYQVGDLLVKECGKTSVQLVIEVKDFGVYGYLIKLLDMQTKQERKYNSRDISGWLFYKHYPVKV
jgi:hypothetical protein